MGVPKHHSKSPRPALYGSVTVAPKSVCRKVLTRSLEVSRSRHLGLKIPILQIETSTVSEDFDQIANLPKRLHMSSTRELNKLPLQQAPVKVLQLHD